MRVEEVEVAVSKLAAAASRAGTTELRHGQLAKQLAQHSASERAQVLEALGGKATEDSACLRLLLLLADVVGQRQAMGDTAYDAYRVELADDPHGRGTDRFIRSVSALDPARLELFRAKSTVLLQAVTTINERLAGEHLPLFDPGGLPVLERLAAESAAGDRELRVELGALPEESREVARQALLDAQLEAMPEEDAVRIHLSEEQVKVLGSPSGIGMIVGAGGAARLSEAALQRQATFIVKRFCLVVRSASMYPPDHPGLPPAFEALKATIESTLEGKAQVTLAVRGGEVLLDGIKVRAEDRFVETFANLLRERAVSQLTFRRGIGVDEIKALVFACSESPTILKEKGGLARALERRNVRGIVVDRPRAEEPGDESTADAADESLARGEILARLGSGEIDRVPDDQLGRLVKEALASPDEDHRRGLAHVLLALDPSLMGAGFLSSPELRRKLPWATARETLEAALHDLSDEDPDTRERAIDAIGKVMDLAVQRRKETTVSTTTHRLLEYLTATETDPDLLTRGTELLGAMAGSYLRRREVERAAGIVRLLEQLAAGSTEIATTGDASGQVLYVSFEGREAVLAAARGALHSVGDDPSLVDVTVAAAMDPEGARAEPAMALLDALDTDRVVERLFQVFLEPDRSIRSRAYKLLRQRGERALHRIEVEIEARSLENHPDRDPSTHRFSDDGHWYILRNCLDLVCEIDVEVAAEVLAALVRDPDPRARRECVHLMARHTLPGCEGVLRAALRDTSPEVRERAIQGVGSIADETAVESLIELFHRYPKHRKAILKAMEQIASPSCVDFLLKAIDTLDVGPTRRRHRPEFPEDPEALMQAMTALGAIGGPEIEERLGRFVDRWSSPIRRWMGRSVSDVMGFQDLLKAAQAALAMARRRGRAPHR